MKYMMVGFFVLMTSLVTAHADNIDKSLWWNEAWWSEGKMEVPQNHDVVVSWEHYKSGDIDVPVMVARPKDNKKYPAVFFQHGRRGMDDLIQRHAKRLAARGFVVFAPDVYQAHFVATHPLKHDYAMEKDANAGIDVLLKRKDISSNRACLYSHTRGGYFALKLATTFKRQDKDIACFVSFYPHLQDPNAGEAEQVYGFAPEVNNLILPTLIFIGEQEQYQRRRVIETSIKVMRDKKRDAQLIIYPGVGRGFDFRAEHVRTFADDLASKDALLRAAAFLHLHLEPSKN